MKLIKFNAETLPKTFKHGKNVLPAISVCKNGIFSLNKAGVELLKGSNDTKYAIAQDPEEPRNWYLFKDEKGFSISARVFELNGTADFSHKSLQISFCEAMSFDVEKTHRFLLAGKSTVVKGDSTEYFGILIPNN